MRSLRKLPKLKLLYLSGCTRVVAAMSETAVDNWEEARPDCKLYV